MNMSASISLPKGNLTLTLNRRMSRRAALFDVWCVSCPSPEAVSCPVLFCLTHFSSGASVPWFSDGRQTSAASRCGQRPSSSLALLTSRTTFRPPLIRLEFASNTEQSSILLAHFMYQLLRLRYAPQSHSSISHLRPQQPQHKHCG